MTFPLKNTQSRAKVMLRSQALANGFDSLTDFVVSRIQSGDTITSLWSAIGQEYSSRRMFDNICRRSSPDADLRICVARGMDGKCRHHEHAKRERIKEAVASNNSILSSSIDDYVPEANAHLEGEDVS